MLKWFLGSLALVSLFLPSCFATLWYNGDFNQVTGLSNGSNYQFQDAWIYDDFIAPSGWHVTGVFSNNFFSLGSVPASSARWEIRSGVSAGSGGILIGSGTDVASATA